MNRLNRLVILPEGKLKVALKYNFNIYQALYYLDLYTIACNRGTAALRFVIFTGPVELLELQIPIGILAPPLVSRRNFVALPV